MDAWLGASADTWRGMDVRRREERVDAAGRRGSAGDEARAVRPALLRTCRRPAARVMRRVHTQAENDSFPVADTVSIIVM
jgi:hypothetical protein